MTNKKERPDDPGRMCYWIGRTLAEAARARGLKREHIAMVLGGSTETIRRMELGRQNDGWPRMNNDIDYYVYGYAELLGVDPRELWRKAIDSWLNDGVRLDFKPRGGQPQDLLRWIEEIAQPRQQARDGDQQTRPSKTNQTEGR